MRRRKSRRRTAVARAPIPKTDGPNSRWSTDFVQDQLANGRRFRVLTIIDDVTKECLAAIPDTSPSGKRAVREMRALLARRGKPGMIVSDNGAEFTSSAVLAFTQEAKLDWRYIAPGKPTRDTPAPRVSRGGCGTKASDLSPRLGPRRTGISRVELGEERQRGALQRLKRCRGVSGEDLHRSSVAERRMRAFGVVVATPPLDLLAGVPKRSEPVQIQAFVAELAVQALDEGVLDGQKPAQVAT